MGCFNKLKFEVDSLGISTAFQVPRGSQVTQVGARTQQTAPPSLTRSGDVAPESWMNMGKSENETVVP